MRSYNNLYESMLQDNYIKQCFIDAAKGKKRRNRNNIKQVLENIDEETEKLKKILQEEMFIPDYHKEQIINDGSKRKVRKILKPYYKYEQVVHHCTIGQFKTIVMNGLYEFSCGSIPKRGVHYGKKYMRKWIDSYDEKKLYILKMDIQHFFESINRTILKEKLRKVIRDDRFYRLLCILIEYDRIAETVKILEDETIEMSVCEVKGLVTYIAFDNNMAVLNLLYSIGVCQETLLNIKKIICNTRKGVPLGYYTSQWFGNFFLKEFDHYVKEELKATDYMRYMDDMVILGRNKKKLHKIKKAIQIYLHEKLDLELKGDWQLFRFEYIDRNGAVKGRMLDFMGFQFHYNRTTIRKSTLESARRKAYHIAKSETISWYNASVMLSYMGGFKHTDTYDYYLKYIKPNVNIKKLKKIVSKHSKKENKERRKK